MLRYFIIITISTYLSLQKCDSVNLEIGHYSNVTLKSCGRKTLKTPLNSCFKWHQSIREDLEVMKSIKGGGYAESGEFPFTVFIRAEKSDDNVSCTGSIINSRWIVTAAHCVVGFSVVKVYAGFTEFPLDLTKDFIGDKDWYWLRKYKDNSDYDIALILLKRELQIRDNVNSICLPKPETDLKIYTPTVATFTGWGYVSDTEVNSFRLKKIPIKWDDENAVAKLFIESSYIVDGQICSGDSGGPLFQYIDGRAVLIGIAFSIVPEIRGTRAPCNVITSMKFASVVHHVNWIRETITKYTK